MNQVIHILKKDLRRFRRAIFVSLVLLVFYAWHESLGWGPLVDNNSRSLIWAQSVTILFVIWWLLITMVVHEEKLAGTRQFWLTRPYGRGNLLAAKFMFVVVTILLPLFIAQLYLLSRWGFAQWRYFPVLLWMNLRPAVLIVLPLMVMASVTESRRQIAFAFFVAVLCLGGIGWLSLVVHGFGLFEYLTFFGPQTVDTMAAIKPLIEGARVALAASGCFWALLLQYRRRSTAQTLVLTALFVALLTGTVLLPGTWLVSRFYPPASASQLPVRFELLHPSASSSQAGGNWNESGLGLPVLAAANSADSAIVVEGILLDLEAADGRKWSSGWQPSRELLIGRLNDFSEYFPADGKFFAGASGGLVKARISLAFTILRLRQPWRRVLQAGEFRVPGAGLCSAVYNNLSTDAISCLSPLPVPVYILAGTTIAASACKSDLVPSPFKGGVVYGLPLEKEADLPGPGFGISPVHEQDYLLSSIENSAMYDYPFSGAGTFCAGTPITFRQAEVAQRAMIQFEAGDIRLADYRDHRSFADFLILRKKNYPVSGPTEAGH